MGNARLMISRRIIQGTFSEQMAALQLPIRKKFAIEGQSSSVIRGVWLSDSSLVWDCLIRMGLLRKLPIRI